MFHSIDQLCHYLHERCVNLNRKKPVFYNLTHVCKKCRFYGTNLEIKRAGILDFYVFILNRERSVSYDHNIQHIVK